MRTLAALIDAYHPRAGDVIYVDMGNYRLYRNLALGEQNSGLQIVGPVGAGAVYDRHNYNSTRYAVELQGASDVILQNLSITGGFVGIYTHPGLNNSNLEVSGSVLYDNQNGGIDIEPGAQGATVHHNFLYGTPGTPGLGQAIGVLVNGVNGVTVSFNVAHDQGEDIAVSGDNATVSGNTAYNGAGGAAIAVSGANMVVTGNLAHDSGTGLSLSGTGTASGNTARDNTGTGISASASGGSLAVTGSTAYNDAVGIAVSGGASAAGNVVHNANEGITTSGGGSDVLHNRVYAITGPGVHAYADSDVEGNVLYNTQQGILAEGGPYSGFSGTLRNNLSYANANEGIRIHAGDGAVVANNTVYQIVGDAVHLDQGSRNVHLRNNILYVLAGYDLFFAPDSQSGMDSDHSLFFLGEDPSPRSHLAFWDDQNVDLNTGGGNPLSNWVAASGLDPNSAYGDPLFTDKDGPDNILGYTVANGGYDGGLDDNFYLRPGSPAIDAGNAAYAPPTDLLGYARTPPPDVGAYEFLGAANDTTPPRVVGTSPAALHAGGNLSLGTIRVTFSEGLNPVDATVVPNYDLRAPGADGIYDNGDDLVVPLRVVGYDAPSRTVTLAVAVDATTLAAGAYRFTVYGNDHGRGVRDTSDNWLDGDDNGTPGGN
jgi:hypothetical protein